MGHVSRRYFVRIHGKKKSEVTHLKLKLLTVLEGPSLHLVTTYSGIIISRNENLKTDLSLTTY